MECLGNFLDLATRFVQQGIAVTVLTAAIAGRPERFEDAGVQVRALRGTAWHRYGRRWWQTTREAFEQELLGRCDLVLSVSAGGFGLLPIRQRHPDLPFVLQAHGTSVGEIISKWRSGRVKAMASSLRNVAWIGKDLAAYRQFDAIVAVGERVAADLSAWPMRACIDRRRLETIPNGVDTDLFRPDAAARARVRQALGFAEDLRVVVSASRLHPQKGLDLGLDAFARLAGRRADLRYLIVGEGPESRALQRRADDLGVADRVHFAGGVRREEVAGYLNAADVMSFTTTRAEGNPLNVLEALSAGLPVVASRHLYRNGAPSEAIVLVDPGDPAAVAAALQRALAIGPSRHGRLPAGLSMAESVQAYLELFAALIAGRVP